MIVKSSKFKITSLVKYSS